MNQSLVIVPITCAITDSILEVPVRNQQCKLYQCVFNLDNFINSYCNQLISIDNTQIKCPVCNQLVDVSKYCLDLDTAYYINEAKIKYPQVIEVPYEDADDFFGSLVIANKLWCILTSDKKLINLQSPNMLPMDQDQKVIELEIEEINKQITVYLQDLAKRLENYQMPIKILQQNFIQEFNQSIKENVALVTIPNSASYYEDMYTFTALFSDFTVNRQTIIYIFVPNQQKWYCTSLIVDQNIKFQHFDYCSMAKIFKNFNNKHSVMIYGGLKDREHNICSNELFEVDIFSQNPEQIQKESIIKILPPNMNAKAQATCISYNNNFIVLGGKYYHELTKQYQVTNTVECFNTQKQTWQSLQNIPKLRGSFNIAKWDKKAYIFGGYEEIDFQNKIQSRNIDILDLDKMVWNTLVNVLPLQQMQTTRHFQARGLGFFKPVNKLLVFGGGRLELVQNEEKDYNREQFLTEFCLDTNINTITDIQSINEFNKIDNNFPENSIYDYQATYQNGRVYFSHTFNINTPRLIVYDQYQLYKLRCKSKK